MNSRFLVSLASSIVPPELTSQIDSGKRWSDLLEDASVKALIENWSAQGVSWCGRYSSLLPTLTQNESIAGNIRILVKCALIESDSRQSEQYWVKRRYVELEKLIREQCAKQGITYTAEFGTPSAREQSLQRLGGKPNNLEILQYENWLQLNAKLKSVSLKGAQDLLPYRHAIMESAILRFAEANPIARYAQVVRVEKAVKLYDIFMAAYCISLWDLAGIVYFRYNSEHKIRRIAPPIVETYMETQVGIPRQVHAIVDGLHRCLAARRIGFESIRTVRIIEAAYPLMALPVGWDEVQECEALPSHNEKRRYRFSTFEELCATLRLHKLDCPQTKKNYRYFFYRDLSELGSDGPRRSP